MAVRVGAPPANELMASPARASKAARAVSAREARIPIEIRDRADAIAWLNRHDSHELESLLTADGIAGTREVYRFDSSLPGFPAGLPVYATPLAGGGECLLLGAGMWCTETGPTPKVPVVGGGLDVDGERSGDPFAIVGRKLPEVQSVTYTCGGTTYPAEIVGSLVVFVGPPSGAFRFDDCTQRATLANGEVLLQ